MENEKRSMHICFSPEQIKVIENYAKKRGLMNNSQAIENLVNLIQK